MPSGRPKLPITDEERHQRAKEAKLKSYYKRVSDEEGRKKYNAYISAYRAKNKKIEV